ncbi:unnamed protein product [marine sediment metagenome]|uniref:Uncharacterized protein n=1 Tax=marine sediment metagenome TaxID=412755 RepID=X1L8T9_9ZZZZ
MQELILVFGIDMRRGTKTFTTEYMKHGLYPFLGGALLHKAANRLGVNRAIARSGIPWIRI